jgi:hypothetical protein
MRTAFVWNYSTARRVVTHVYGEADTSGVRLDCGEIRRHGAVSALIYQECPFGLWRNLAKVDAFFVVSKRSDGQGFDRSGKFFRTICSGSKSDARWAGGAAYESRGGNFGNGALAGRQEW